MSDDGSDDLRGKLLTFIRSGGLLLMEAPEAKWLFGISSQRCFIDYIQPSEDSLFGSVLPGFIDASLLVPEGADVLLANDQIHLVQIMKEGEGTAVILPGGLSALVLNNQVRRRQFSSVSRFFPTERVARCSKHTVREIIQCSLEFLFSERDLPFVSLYPFPDGEPSLFNLRIDTDFADQQHISDLYNLCGEHNIPATWFVETGSAKGRLKQFAEMKNQEIGLHCFQHKVFEDYRESEADIKQGKSLLTNEQIITTGYAAPFGEWNPQLARAVENSGFHYSTEFGLDYDDYPFYPWLGDHFSSLLQVPVHPISAGRLMNARHNEEEMKNYFTKVLERNLAHRLPLFIYEHPSSANLDVLNWIIKWIKEHQIPTVSLGAYVEWWQNRSNINWSAEYSNEVLSVREDRKNNGIWLSVKDSQGRESVAPISDEISLDELNWQEPASTPAAIPMAVRNRVNRKMITNSFDRILAKLKP